MTQVLLRPIITEKSMRGGALGKYTFEVARSASKPQIRDAVEHTFDVRVVKVNVINVRGRAKIHRGRHWFQTSPRRKAIVTLAAGEKIDLERLTG